VHDRVSVRVDDHDLVTDQEIFISAIRRDQRHDVLGQVIERDRVRDMYAAPKREAHVAQAMRPRAFREQPFVDVRALITRETRYAAALAEFATAFTELAAALAALTDLAAYAFTLTRGEPIAVTVPIAEAVTVTIAVAHAVIAVAVAHAVIAVTIALAHAL